MMVVMVKKINHKFLYLFLGVASFVIGLILAPFSPTTKHGSSLNIDKNITNAEEPSPDPSPSPDPCPTPDPSPGCSNT